MNKYLTGAHTSVCWRFCLLLALSLSACQSRPQIAGGVIKGTPVVLGPDWLDLNLTKPIIAKWDRQVVFLSISSDVVTSDVPLGAKATDGSVFTPEIEIYDDSGREYTLQLIGIAEHELQFGNEKIPKGTRFSRIRIRSPKRLPCSEISWMSYVPTKS